MTMMMTIAMMAMGDYSDPMMIMKMMMMMGEIPRKNFLYMPLWKYRGR